MQLRDEAYHEFMAVISRMLRAGMEKNCTNCRFFRSDVTDANKELCMKFNLRPPAHIIVNSCEGYEDVNSIPF